MTTAMALYCGRTDEGSLFGGGAGRMGMTHSSGSRLPPNQLNQVELAVPRPRRVREKKATEASLYPSKADIEGLVPDATLSFDDNGSFAVLVQEAT